MRSSFFVLVFAFSLTSRAVDLLKVCGGLDRPVYAVVTPSEPNLIFVVEQKGRIVTCDSQGKVKEFLNIKRKVAYGGEMGLLGLAFHPQYATNKKFYVYYSAEKANRVNLVAEYQAPHFTERVLMSVIQPYSNHDGGHLEFDSQGLLYIGKGDGGAGYDPYGNGQNLNSLLGKILRIDVDREDPKRKTAYSIPADNPFANGGGSPEIYAYGIRNPWRFSFDRETGKLWLGDVGQDRYEEIDIVEKGKNYGWKEREGKHCLSTSPKCKTEGLTDPLFEYDHNQGQSITGGYVYRGNKIPSLKGHYIYGDYVSGKVWALLDSQGKVTNRELFTKSLDISSFGLDHDNELLVVSHQGVVYRLVP